ncbi:hypothetical protein GE061_001357 [Apolygus lucorum]|uniref:Uncharacterized protein n=1 Tax=Apolygus lucorum TaxID=248454 RepID=A0A8S9YDS3_APOLU|nr:hypothetical protein GE061_001357 [Apolygus lucorum]
MHSGKADGHRLVVRLPENGTARDVLDGKPILPPIEEEGSLPPVEPSHREPGKGVENWGNFTMRRQEEVPLGKKYGSLVHWPYNQPVGYKERPTFGDPIVLPEDWSWFDNPKGKETSSRSKPRLVGVTEIGRASGDGVAVKGTSRPTAEETPPKDWAVIVSGRERASLLSTRLEKGKDEWVPPNPREGDSIRGEGVEVPREVSEALSTIKDLILDFRSNKDVLAATRRARADTRYLVPMEAALAKVRLHVEEQAKEASFWRTELHSRLERQGEAIVALEVRLSASPNISFEEGELRGPPLQQGLVLLEQARKELWTDVVRKGRRPGAPTGTAVAGGKNGEQKPVPTPRTGLAGTSKASSRAAKGKTDGGASSGEESDEDLEARPEEPRQVTAPPLPGEEDLESEEEGAGPGASEQRNPGGRGAQGIVSHPGQTTARSLAWDYEWPSLPAPTIPSSTPGAEIGSGPRAEAQETPGLSPVEATTHWSAETEAPLEMPSSLETTPEGLHSSDVPMSGTSGTPVTPPTPYWERDPRALGPTPTSGEPSPRPEGPRPGGPPVEMVPTTPLTANPGRPRRERKRPGWFQDFHLDWTSSSEPSE